MLVNCNTIYQRNLPQSSQIEFITASSVSPPEFLYASIITEGVITVYMALVPRLDQGLFVKVRTVCYCLVTYTVPGTE